MRRRLGVLVLVLGLVGCSPDPRPDRARPDPLDVAALRVTASTPVPGDEAVRLSPDGGHLLRISRPSCVTALDGSGEQCVDPDEVAEPDARPRELDTASIRFFAPRHTAAAVAPDKLLINDDGEHVLLSLAD